MNKIRFFLSTRLSDGNKQWILNIWRKFQFQNILFFLTFGAVPNEKAKVQISELSNLNDVSRSNLAIISKAIEEANSKMLWPVPPRLRFINGMSGQSFRLVLNRITAKKKNYLEIGTWRGSTACSAIYKNNINTWLIDNWSEFGGPAKDALKNLSKSLGNKSKLSILSEDFRKVDYGVGVNAPIDIYLFDGPHSQEDHMAGVQVINSLRFDSLIFIVDDWNWEDVRLGTLTGLQALNSKVVCKIEILTATNKRFHFSRWHNGYCFFLIETAEL